MLTREQYFTGPDGVRRDLKYAKDMTPQIEASAALTIARASKLLYLAGGAGVTLELHANGSPLNSGWRPPSVNAGTQGAAVKSKHMTGEAVDVFDADGDLDDWLMTAAGQRALAACSLWHEHPAATKGWAHVQIVPPRSGKRTFFP